MGGRKFRLMRGDKKRCYIQELWLGKSLNPWSGFCLTFCQQRQNDSKGLGNFSDELSLFIGGTIVLPIVQVSFEVLGLSGFLKVEEGACFPTLGAFPEDRKKSGGHSSVGFPVIPFGFKNRGTFFIQLLEGIALGEKMFRDSLVGVFLEFLGIRLPIGIRGGMVPF